MTSTRKESKLGLTDLRAPNGGTMLMAVDPGPSTGWAVTVVEDRESLPLWFACGQTHARYFTADLFIFITRRGREPFQMVIERFMLTGGPHSRGKDAEVTVQMIGKVTQLLESMHLPAPFIQIPSDRVIARDEVLKSIGWYKKGERDALSASKHLLSFMVNHGYAPKGALLV